MSALSWPRFSFLSCSHLALLEAPFLSLALVPVFLILQFFTPTLSLFGMCLPSGPLSALLQSHNPGSV